MTNFSIDKSFILLLLSSCCVYFVCGQDLFNALPTVNQTKKIRWCVVGDPENFKCGNFSLAALRDKHLFRQKGDYSNHYYDITCVKAFNKDDCKKLIEEEKADLTTLDAGEVFSAGRYYSLVPILQEYYLDSLNNYYAVAVIRKGTLKDVNSLHQLRGKKACFAGVESLAGWIIPIVKLMERAGLEIVDCNNHVKNAVNFFGPSCAVNSLLDKYNPIGDNSDKLCKLCIGAVGKKCTVADPYAGFTGAFRCLLEAGEIAFLKHTTVMELTADRINFPSVSKDDFELLCPDGSRKPVDDFIRCQWGSVPSHAVVTSSAKDVKTRLSYQKFLEMSFQLYGPNPEDRLNLYNSSTPASPFDPYGGGRIAGGGGEYGGGGGDDFYSRNREGGQTGRGWGEEGAGGGRAGGGRQSLEGAGGGSDFYNQRFFNNHSAPSEFRLVESVPLYGSEHDLLFSDSTVKLTPIREGVQTFKEFLGKAFELIVKLRNCPVKAVTLCITSDPEMEKCLKMRTALKAQLLEPELVCYKGYSHTHCMQAIRNGDADISVFDAGDVYSAGLNYRLVPIMSEVYNLGVPEYFAVAVAKEEDPDTEITYLRGKNTCHGAVNTGAGWIIPMAFLLSNGWMRSYGCDSMKAAAQYFSKMCLPGSQATEYNTGLPYDNMCHLCHGSSFRYCHRDASEDYYGHTGAFRCLVEGGGDVAFVKHTTVLENTDGKRKEWWARNTLNEDFQLLCPDGTRATMDRYKECNLGRVKANAIVTRGGDAYNITQINAYINLFTYAQQFYGRKDQDDFNFAMFYSKPPYADLIFQDATTQLVVVPPALRWYSDYLGPDFMRAKRIVDCHAGASHLLAPVSLIALTLAYLVIV